MTAQAQHPLFGFDDNIPHASVHYCLVCGPIMRDEYPDGTGANIHQMLDHDILGTVDPFPDSTRLQ